MFLAASVPKPPPKRLGLDSREHEATPNYCRPPIGTPLPRPPRKVAAKPNVTSVDETFEDDLNRAQRDLARALGSS